MTVQFLPIRTKQDLIQLEKALSALRSEISKDKISRDSLAAAWKNLRCAFPKGDSTNPSVSTGGDGKPDKLGFKELVRLSANTLINAKDMLLIVPDEYQKLNNYMACNERRSPELVEKQVGNLNRLIDDIIPVIRNCRRIARTQKRMTWRDADKVGRRLHKDIGRKFSEKSIRAQADMVGCSFGTWKKTQTYLDINATRIAKTRSPKMNANLSRRASSVDIAVEAESYQEWKERERDDRDSELDALIQESNNDFEPSPLSDYPKKVRAYKRM